MLRLSAEFTAQGGGRNRAVMPLPVFTAQAAAPLKIQVEVQLAIKRAVTADKLI
ncbi:hypothetical protein [Saccharopolyspora elongata]|uniref:hypothetical protein n=1 Tax=Saccharopolyspora elongata TaxID=2530387 RepID=UPI0014044797|nr:hypothetical protein [Saccharopolyspora elongata]